MTSAPWSPSTIVQIGPARTRDRSTTLRPASAPVTPSALSAAASAPASIPEHVARDDQLLDLAGALVDPGDARVPVEVLDLHVLAVAHATVDLHGFVDDTSVGLGADELRHRGLAARGLARIDERGGVIRELSRGRGLGGHL